MLSKRVSLALSGRKARRGSLYPNLIVGQVIVFGKKYIRKK